MLNRRPTVRQFCCYLSGEVNCTNKDCFLVGVAGLMAALMLIGLMATL